MRPDQYEVLNEAIEVDHDRMVVDFLCYGRIEYDIDALIDDVVHDRVSIGLWPTRDLPTDCEEC